DGRRVAAGSHVLHSPRRLAGEEAVDRVYRARRAVLCLVEHGDLYGVHPGIAALVSSVRADRDVHGGEYRPHSDARGIFRFTHSQFPQQERVGLGRLRIELLGCGAPGPSSGPTYDHRLANRWLERDALLRAPEVRVVSSLPD